jgi:glutamate/aspartate transport system substrate-binding protein
VLVWLLLILTPLPIVTSRAGEPDPRDTLARVRQDGVVRLGVRRASVPFSFEDEAGAYQGYSIDLCQAVIDRIGALAGMPAIRTAFVPVTSASRIPQLLIGDIDLECGSTSNTAPRAKHVAFSHTTFVVSIVAAVKHPSLQNLQQLRREPELARLGIALTSGTTAAGALRQFEADTGLVLTRRFTPDHDESFRLLVEGKVAAFVHDDVLLAALVAQYRRDTKASTDHEAAAIRILDLQLQQDHYALMVRKEDERLLRLVNEVLTDLMTSGEIITIYERWFVQPIGGHGPALELGLSPANLAAFGKPMTYSAGGAGRP